MRKYTNFLSTILAIAALVSCDKGGNAPALPSGSTFLIEANAEGSSATNNITLSGDWSVSNDISWCSVSPLGGEAGDNHITVTALTSNENLQERIGKFKIISDGEPQEFFVIQRGARGIFLPKSRITANPSGGTLTFNVEGNQDFEVSSDSDWVKIESSEMVKEGEVLEDGVTHSDYCTYSVTVSTEENTGSEARNAIITLKGKEQSYELTIKQLAEGSLDFTSRFYRRSLGIRFTATWCGYCPMMGEAFANAMKGMPDRIVGFYCHPLSSKGGMAWSGTTLLEDFYQVSGYPTGYINNIARVRNYPVSVTTAMVTGLAQEAIDDYPAKTAIAASTKLEGNKIKISASIATKEALEYKINAFILEDGIVFAQASAEADYVHNYVVRQNITDMFGDPIPDVSENGISDIELEAEVPESVLDKNNMYVVLFVTYPGEPTAKDVSGAEYINVGTIVDNVVKVPLNGSVDFMYEPE